MKNILLQAKITMLFFDILAWIIRIDSWSNLRKESNTNYQTLKRANLHEVNAALFKAKIELANRKVK